ncbi:outer membrane protein transport protein [Thiomicrorhabdus sp. zzn3]|uniref:OmpP1/FadL family transporter n=1 Tax=Thiomicrorhabdus sp. zzn3 TaxID=3039775 RepID=UPI002436A180|nr:outer membrane protein transport protein [Thiomicrorhabdus sp. zzn3]MDG6777440.1 outer membrane protein transport protein [Thiomicrorhabdus sp. zzn3]
MKPFARIVFPVLAMSSPAAMASGFALIEQSASGQGLSYAGAAANTEDASVMWFNAAGLTDIEGNQAIAGLHVILPENKFTNNGSNIGGVVPLTGDDNPATTGLVPNLYWKGDYAGYAIGFGVNVPYGQKLEYQDDWAGRYQALKTDLKSLNLNANVARKISDSTSIGLGINAQYVDLDMSSAAQVGEAQIKANSWGYGFNVGVLSQLTPATKLGVAYRSEVVQNAKGDLETVLGTQKIQSDVTLPATASMSFVHSVSDRMQILADATWTNWKAYDELVIEDSAGNTLSETNQNFKDSMRYSVGMIYDYSDRWRLRTGVAFDETPVPDAESRSPRTPDSNKTWLSVGFNYQVSPSMSLDAGYSRLFADKAKINKFDASSNSYLIGEYETSVDIISAQLVWNY